MGRLKGSWTNFWDRHKIDLWQMGFGNEYCFVQFMSRAFVGEGCCNPEADLEWLKTIKLVKENPEMYPIVKRVKPGPKPKKDLYYSVRNKQRELRRRQAIKNMGVFFCGKD